MKNIFYVIILFMFSCSEQPIAAKQNKQAVRPETSGPSGIETITLLASCPKNNSHACMETYIPNICNKLSAENIVQPKFCQPWEYISPSYKTANTSFVLPVASKHYSGSTRIFGNTKGSPCEDQMTIAFLGFSAEGFPLILSNMGAIEIQSPFVQIGYENARVLVDVKEEKIVQRYMAPHDNTKLWSFSFPNNDDAYLAYDNKCFKLPIDRSEKLSISSKGCKLSNTDSFKFSDFGLSKASNEDIRIAKALFPKQVVDYFIFDARIVKKIKGTDYLVINLLEACT